MPSDDYAMGRLMHTARIPRQRATSCPIQAQGLVIDPGASVAIYACCLVGPLVVCVSFCHPCAMSADAMQLHVG